MAFVTQEGLQMMSDVIRRNLKAMEMCSKPGCENSGGIEMWSKSLKNRIFLCRKHAAEASEAGEAGFVLMYDAARWGAGPSADAARRVVAADIKLEC